MKKIFLFTSFFCILLLNKKLHSQSVITCSNDSIKLRAGNHQYGILEWEKSQDAVNWEKIHNQHDTTYVFKPKAASYYRSVNKLPNCAPIISSEVLVQKPPVSNAGQDRLINEVFVFLGANTAVGSTGTWSVIEGTEGNFEDINNPNTKFSGTTGKYILQWQLENTCGTSNDTVKIEFIENHYQDKIVIVDETDTMLSTEQQIADGKYIIQFNDPVPTIDTETILIGTVDSGYLREVKTVSQNGNTFSMTTEQGKLDDLFIDGGFELGNVFKIDSVLPASKSSNYKKLNKRPTRGEILSNPNLQKGVHYYLVDEKISSLNNNVKMKRVTSKTSNANEEENPKFKFTLSNTLFDKNGINIKLDGSLTFTPNVFADYKTNWIGRNPRFNLGLNNATVDNNYKFTMTCDAQANVLDETFNLFNYTKSVYFLVGGVPVLVDVIVDFEGKASADVSANLTFVHQFTNTLTVNAGVSYSDDTWSNYYNSSVKNKLETDLDISGGFIQNFEIGPKITFKIYKVVGPYIGAKLTEELNICANSSNLGNVNWESDLDIGAKLTVGVRADIFKKNLFDFSKTWNKKGLYNVNFPYELEVISGNHQQYSTSSPLINPVKVRVISNKGFAIPGVNVKFEADPDTPGIIDSEYVITDSNGYAETNWTPTNNDFAKLTATVQNCEGKNIGNSPLTFEATEVQANDCTQTTLNASYRIENNTIKPTAHMGNVPYSYSTDNINFSTTIPQLALNNGQKYNFAIKDANGCTAFTSYTHKETTCNNSGLDLELSVYGANLYANGKEGTPPYQYALNDATTYRNANVFNNLSNGIQKVKDANGCIETNTINITNSTSDLVAYFEVEDAKTFTPITLNNLSNNANSFLWDFGDGNTSTIANPIHYFANEGQYTIELTATNNLGETNIFSKIISIIHADSNKIFQGDVTLKTQAEVETFGKNNYEIINGYLWIGSSSNITNLSSLNSITVITGSLIIGQNNVLENLDGLNSLKTINALGINNNPLLTNINAISNITDIGMDITLYSFSINNNPKLKTLDGLSGLHYIPGFSNIVQNESLNSLEGLSNIIQIDYALEIISNQNLTNLSGLQISKGPLYITNNNALITLAGLENLNSITDLNISSNSSLTSLEGLNNLNRVEDKLSIQNNENLTNLCAIRELVASNNVSDYKTSGNAFNPTKTDMDNNNCNK